MKLYFLPLACSLASRITIDECGLDVELVHVDPHDKSLPDGRPYREVNPLELVPALEDGGVILTENVAILAHLSELSDKLAPKTTRERGRLLQLLAFIGTELHAGVFRPMFDRTATEAARDHALSRAPKKLAHTETLVAGRTWLLDDFSAADAYLLTILNWAQATPVSLDPFPELVRYLQRGLKRPSVQAAVQHELPLYLQERQVAKAAAAAAAPA